MGRKMIGIGAPTSTGGAVLEGNIGINMSTQLALHLSVIWPAVPHVLRAKARLLL